MADFSETGFSETGFSETGFFDFEADFTDSLRCIPMSVRYKLDTCGVKLKLNHWHRFSPVERQQLVALPCLTAPEVAAYRSHLHQLIQSRTGDQPTDLPIASQPDWLNPAQIPDSVMAQAESVAQSITLEQWHQLSPLQRFALIKLSRSQHENSNFLPALKEFNLVAS
jgi:hypothetical protein